MADSTILGVRTSRVRDGVVRHSHRPAAFQGQAWALHLHFGESSSSQATIWHEGEQRLDMGWKDSQLTCPQDHVYLHPHPIRGQRQPRVPRPARA